MTVSFNRAEGTPPEEPKETLLQALGLSDSVQTALDMRYGSFERRRHTEAVKHTPKQIADFQKWEKEYTALLETGIELNYLHEGDSDGYRVWPLEGRTTLVYDETEEEYCERVDRAYNIFEENGEWPTETRPRYSIWSGGLIIKNDEWIGLLRTHRDNPHITQAMYDRYLGSEAD